MFTGPWEVYSGSATFPAQAMEVEMEIWTDGSCFPNPGPGGWGWHRSDGRSDCGGAANTTTRVDARFEWIRGHSGDPGRERADDLAALGAAKASR